MEIKVLKDSLSFGGKQLYLVIGINCKDCYFNQFQSYCKHVNCGMNNLWLKEHIVFKEHSLNI